MCTQPVVVWQMKPTWGLPNASPFCMKLETWLRMAGVPYELRTVDRPSRSPTGKVPFIERPDGSRLADSSVIVRELTREFDVHLDDHLTPEAEAMGVLLQRTFEEDLYFQVLYDRWARDENWRIVETGYFGHFPRLLRLLILPMVRRQVIRSAHGQGIGRLSQEERDAKARTSVRAIAVLLGDRPYFFGEPSRFDATAYAFIGNALGAPPEILSAASEAVRAEPNLVAYEQRMRTRYFPSRA